MLAGGERMTPELFAIAPRLRAIARTGVGYDLIDVAAASAHKVAVTITPGTNQESVAEQTMALLLALTRRIVPNDRVIHSGGWDRALVTPVRGKTLGLIGMGRIGRAVALRALAFRMRVVAFDTFLHAEFDERHGIDRLPLDELLATSDVVSLHLPLTEATRGMVNREFLAKMRPGSYLINTSRGGLIVETDLRDALSPAISPAPAWTCSTTSRPSPATRSSGCPTSSSARTSPAPTRNRCARWPNWRPRRSSISTRTAGRATASSIPNCATAGGGDGFVRCQWSVVRCDRATGIARPVSLRVGTEPTTDH